MTGRRTRNIALETGSHRLIMGANLSGEAGPLQSTFGVWQSIIYASVAAIVIAVVVAVVVYLIGEPPGVGFVAPGSVRL